MSRLHDSRSRRCGLGGGFRGGGGTLAARRLCSGTIQGLIDVANALPRNGPSGTDSRVWMSLALQSSRMTAPNTWSSNASTGTQLLIGDGTPTMKPSSTSTSSLRVGRYIGGPDVGLMRPDGRITGVPDTTIVPARPW